MESTTELVTESVMDLSKEPEGPPPVKTFRTMTMGERWQMVKDHIIVEPLVIPYLMASTIAGPALNNLEIEKACKSNLGFNDTVCEAVLRGEQHSYPQNFNEIVTVILGVRSWLYTVYEIVPIILILFLGSYSDRLKWRKPFLLIPICGEFFAVAGCVLCVVFMSEWRLEVLGVLQVIVPSLVGGPPMMTMAAFAYIADVTSVEQRTTQIAILSISMGVVDVIFSSFSGILFRVTDYYTILGLAVIMYMIAIWYGIFCIKEEKRVEVSDTKTLILDAFNPKYAIETFNVVLQKNPGTNRIFLNAILFLLFIMNVVATGESGVWDLYLQKTFEYTVVENSYLTTVNIIVHTIGDMVGVAVLSNLLHLHDLLILVAGMLDKIAATLILAIVTNLTGLYAAVAVGAFKGVTHIALRSLATKVVSENDLGKAQSLFGLCTAVGGALAAPLYSTLIFPNTLETMPTAYMYVGIMIYAICIILVMWMYFRDKRTLKPEQPTVNEKPVPLEDMVTRI